MLNLSREATVDTFGTSAMSGERQGILAGFSVRLEMAIGAACLAVACFVPAGYPRLVALSIVSLCSFASIIRTCHSE